MEKTVSPLKTIREIKANTFIYEQDNALPAELCQEMIRRFEEYSAEQYAGRIGQTVDQNSSIKKTTDLSAHGWNQHD